MMSSRSASASEIAGRLAFRKLAPQRHSSNPGRNQRNGFMHPGHRQSSDLLWTDHPVMSATSKVASMNPLSATHSGHSLGLVTNNSHGVSKCPSKREDLRRSPSHR